MAEAEESIKQISGRPRVGDSPMDSNEQLVCEENRPVLPVNVCSDSNQEMRYSRHWFLLPFLVNVAFLFSASWLVDTISQNVVDDIWFPLPGWTLFATIAVCAPPCLVIVRLLPDPSVAVAVGGLLTAAGLLWTWLTTGSTHMVSLCILSGSGVSLSLQAAGIAISPYFIRNNITASLGTLLLSATVMLVLCPLMNHANGSNHRMFLYFCLVSLASSLLPLIVYLHSKRKLCTTEQGKQSKWKSDAYVSELQEKLMQMEAENDVTSCDSANSDGKLLVSKDGCAVSCMSLMMWLTWGAGVDTTWLSLGWRYQYFSTPTGLASLQLLLCFVLLTMKICMELSQPCTSLCRINLASNYMQLGLLGTCGMILCLFPEHSRPFHNHLLFTAGFALQYDDLSDLCLVRNRIDPLSVFRHKLIAFHPDETGQEDIKYSPLFSWCCTLCHLVSLFLMSLLAIILGIQLANCLGYLTTLPPLSFICSRGGLVVISLAAVCISLARPHRWIQHTNHILVL